MQKINRKWNPEKIPVFWQFFAMMCAFPVLLVIVLLMNGEHQTEMIVEKNLTEVQLNLDASCKQLTESLLALNELPVSIENSVPYSRITGSGETSLTEKYYPSATKICALLSNQVTYRGNYSEIMIYIPSLDTVCSKNARIQSSESYFADCIEFSDTDEGLILKKLRGRSSLTIYPVEDIKITGMPTARQFAVTCHPINNRTGVMVVITEEELLDMLGYYRLPEGSVLRILTDGGELFEQYPSELLPDESDYYALDSSMLNGNFAVRVWLPAAYFRNLMSTYYNNMLISSALFLLLAFAICFVISKASARPLQQLVEGMESEAEMPQNELWALDRFITNSALELASLKGHLVQSQLIRLFFGNALTTEEEKHLKKDLKEFESLRVALIETERNSDQLRLASDIEERLEKKCMYVIISRTETGFLFSGDGESLKTVTDMVGEINSGSSEKVKKVRCGLSEEFSDLDSFNDALRQARVAMPQKYEARVFTPDGAAVQNIVISWTPHEKLYRSILAKNEADALAVIRKAAMTSTSEHAPIFYDNLAFVILCSANEVGINPQLLKIHHYDENSSAAENFSRLEYPLKKLLAMLSEKEKGNEDNKKQQVMLYIRENFCDSSICIAQIAEDLKIREADVSETVRQYTSQSFTDYIANLRMKKVVDMMTDFSKSLSEIAEECGYPAESTFYRVFKAHYNRTPASYRRNLMIELERGK